MNDAQITPEVFGAQVLVDALVEEGVSLFFANPGTSEIHLVDAIDRDPRARAVLCLFEGVATGAADGWARVTGRPAAVLLHLGPGLANGLANLHNAFKARSPMIVVVGEHAEAHLSFDTPLRSEIDCLSTYAAKGAMRMGAGCDLRKTVREAVELATTAPCGPVLLLASTDLMWVGMAAPAAAAPHLPSRRTKPSSPEQAEAASRLLAGREAAALILGDDALDAEATRLADRIAAATSCRLFTETFNARQERGAGIPVIERLPYFRESAIEKLAGLSSAVLIGSRLPVAFFASPDAGSELLPAGCEVLRLPDDQSALASLRAIAESVAPGTEPRLAPLQLPEMPEGRLIPRTIWSVLARALPEGAIVSDEAGVTSVGADAILCTARPHLWMNLTGGSIGQGLPLATGAAIASPRPVVALHGDGGALYTLQALWTQAHEGAHVVNIIFRNNRYAILQYEVKRHGLGPLGTKGNRMFELTEPPISWVPLATGFGVEACSVETAESFAEELDAAFARQGPSLIEVMLPSR